MAHTTRPTPPRRLIHIAAREPSDRIWTRRFREELAQYGELTIVGNGAALAAAERLALIRSCEVLLTGWGSAEVPAEIAETPGQLQYICNVTGSVRPFVPLEVVEAGIPVTNWGDAPAKRLAEGAMTLLLAAVKDLHQQIECVRGGGWQSDWHLYGGTLDGMRVGIYGLGVIGRRFVDLLRPFGAAMRFFDPYVDGHPADLTRVDSLEALFDTSQAIVIHAGLSAETHHSITAALLARLPDHAVIVNTARGAIIDQEALFAELAAGRLRAGLDVLEPPDSLPPDHPARQWENLILSAHRIGRNPPDYYQETDRLEDYHCVCLENVRRFAEGQPLRFVMDRVRYLRST